MVKKFSIAGVWVVSGLLAFFLVQGKVGRQGSMPASIFQPIGTVKTAGMGIEKSGGLLLEKLDVETPVARGPVAVVGNGLVLDTQEKVVGRWVERTQIIRTGGKYPLVRVEEKIQRDPVTGNEDVLERRAMAADHVIVRLKKGVSRGAVQALGREFKGVEFKRLPFERETFLAHFSPEKIDDFLEILRKIKEKKDKVDYVEPDYLVQVLTAPNDSKWIYQWNINNVRQTGGKMDADIDGAEAWSMATGTNSVKVAVVDTGIDYTHPDLSGNIWTNPGEIAGNSLDDDGNGYADDVRGWNFQADTNDPLDDHYHGTQMAGLVGAVGNNGQYVAGICWNVTLVPVKFLDSTGQGFTSDAVSAISYATAAGAHVILSSWGGPNYSQTVKDSISAAEAAGILFVTAAGNGGIDSVADDMDAVPFYPAGYDLPNIVTVSSSNRNDSPSGFANHGEESVDLYAPGETVYTLLPVTLTTAMNGKMPTHFGVSTGTSTAAPHVAGVAALIKSHQPSLGYAAIKRAILSSVDSLSEMTRKCRTEGRLNAYSALSLSSTILNAEITAPSFKGTVTLGQVATITGSASGTGFSKYDLYYRVWSDSTGWGSWSTIASNVGTPVSGGTLGSWDTTGLPLGIYQLKLEATSTGGSITRQLVRVDLAAVAAPIHLDAAVSSTIPYQITVVWEDRSSGETGFRVERKTGEGGSFAEVGTTAANTTNYVDSSGIVNDGTRYFYRARAWNGAGNSFYSNEDGAPELQAPVAPTNLVATLSGSSAIILVWDDQSSDEQYFKLERKTGAGGGYSQITTLDANATSFTDSDLQDGVQYFYRLRAFGSGGDSSYSNEATVSIPIRLTGPTGLACTALSGSEIRLTWTDNSNNEQGFLIERKTGGGSFVEVDSVGENQTSYTDDYLEERTTYQYRVRAYDSEGESSYSGEASATTLDRLAAPSGLSASTASASGVLLSWTDNTSFESGFKIERKTGSGGTYSEIMVTDPNTAAYLDEGLTLGTQYYYRVRATDDYGNSEYSSEASVTISAPSVPTGLAVTTITSSQIGLSWADSSSIETGFKIERKDGVGGTYVQIATVGANVTAYNSTGLSEGTIYYYRIRATNNAGDSVYSEEVNATTLSRPAAASVLVATRISNSQINLAWVDASNNETSFKIQRKEGSAGLYVEIATVGANVTTHNDTVGLSEGTWYYYRILSSNAIGDAYSYSNEAGAKTLGVVWGAMAGGLFHSVAVKDDGTVWSWGTNNVGQLGAGNTTSRKFPTTNLISGVMEVAAGDSHVVALKTNGSVWSWGYNVSGQLGDGSKTDRTSPVAISSLASNVDQVAAGGIFSAALKSNGQVWTWGENGNGQLGIGSTTDKTSPQQVTVLSNVVEITLGGTHGLAVQSNGIVYAWGLNSGGQLGDGTVTQRTSPVAVSNLTAVIHVKTGTAHNLALKSDGTVWTWGTNHLGQLGIGSTTSQKLPVQITTLSNIVGIAAGGHHSFAVSKTGGLWAWGNNTTGQVGNASSTNVFIPVAITNLSPIIAISGGNLHSLGLSANGSVWSWGYNRGGQLGNGTVNNQAYPLLTISNLDLISDE